MKIPTAKEPAGREWRRIGRTALGRFAGFTHWGDVWESGPIRVISSLDIAKLPKSGGLGAQWHISVTADGDKRPKPHHVRRALRAFGVVDAEEDNHHPGKARHFWLPLTVSERVDCECKTDEVTVTEADGYAWQNAKAPEECRGCEWQRISGEPCQAHAGVSP